MKIENIEKISTEDIVKDESGKVLLLYRLGGILGMILDVDDMPNVKPFDTNGCGRGFYSVEKVPDELSHKAFVTIDDSYSEYTGVVDIGAYPVVNPESRQDQICDFVSLDYYNKDFVESMLITKTNRYYSWTSDRVRMIEKIDKEIEWLRDYHRLIIVDGHFELFYDEEDDWREIMDEELVSMIVNEVKDEWHEMWKNNHGEILGKDPDEELHGMIKKEIDSLVF